jgi:hypothetical protein
MVQPCLGAARVPVRRFAVPPGWSSRAGSCGWSRARLSWQLWYRNLRAVTMAEASPAGKRPAAGRFEIPDGWVARGFEFEVEWPGGAGAVSKIWSHFGARRKAYNWALGQVKADLDARRADPAHVAVPWNLYALRKRWNAEKAVVAPWWAENSKEAYATGIADLCAALKNWSDSRAGKRQGRTAGFPAFRSRRTDRARVRFTTGAMRVEADRRTITPARRRAPAVEGKHPAARAPSRRRPGPDPQHHAPGTLGTAVRLLRLHRRAAAHRADRGTRGR